jgi:hypothetical protein
MHGRTLKILKPSNKEHCMLNELNIKQAAKQQCNKNATQTIQHKRSW